MASLIFLLTVLILFVLLVRLIVKAIRKRPLAPTAKIMAAMVAGYFMLWLLFYYRQKKVTVPLGTNVCFDDWCATVTGVEQGPAIQQQFSLLKTDSTWIVLNLRMSNQARGIGQKPSEPRVHILDDRGHAWPISAPGQQVFEKFAGPQPGIGHRLELHQSLETKLVFAVPKSSRHLKALIEEGPFITRFLFPDDEEVFSIP